MNIREEAIVELRVDDTDASTKWQKNLQEIKEVTSEIKGLKAELKEWQETLKNSEEGSKEWIKARDKVDELKDSLRMATNESKELKVQQLDLKHNIDLSTASIDQMQAALTYWIREAKKAEQGSDEWLAATKKIESIRPVLNEAREELSSFGKETEKQPGFWDNFKASALGAFTGIGLFNLVQEAGRAMWDFGKDVFETTAKFEKYETVLRVALGTQEKAAQAMSDIKDFAASTPFSVDELTESYVKLVNRGLQPSMSQMTQMGDIAASQGKSFEQLTEAILDAGTGEFERLKEFGINASKSGNEVELSFKGVQQTVAKTPEAIQGAILAFGELEGVQGGMLAISETLEGRTSNLGDSFDSLKLLIGGGLNPVFGAIIDVMSWVIDTTKGLITESEPLQVVYENMWSLLKNLWSSYTDLIDSIFGTSEVSITLRDVINGLAIAFQAVSTPVRVAIAVVQGMYDGLNALINKGKEVVNFFTNGDFKVDSDATFDKMQSNFEKNMLGIKTSWSTTMNEVHVNNMKDALDKSIETENNKLKAAKDRIKQEVSSDQEKLTKIQELNKAHDTKVEDMKRDSLKKQTVERISEINRTATTEEERASKTQAVLTEMQKQMGMKEVAAHKSTANTKGTIDTKAADKAKKTADKLAIDKEKAETDMLNKIADMQIKAISDDTARAVAKANLDYKRETDQIKKSLASDASKKKALEAAEKAHETAIAKINADAQKKAEKADADAKNKKDAEDKKEEAAIKKIKNQRLADTKKLLDDEFKAEVANANVELSLTKTNSQAMWTAKLNILNIEAAHKRAKLAQEAADEKARIAESIADNEMKAARIQAVETALAAQLRQSETQLQADKRKLTEESNKAREDNNKAFYAGLNAAMAGDFVAFSTFLQNKARDDGKHLNERSVAFAKHAQEVGEVMLTAVNTLMKLNADYTEKQINNLTKEKNTNFKKLDDELAKGIKTKDEVEAEKTRLQAEFDEKNLALKKKEFERNKKMQIAAALIQGSMAILSALATPPFPLGIALAIVAGVKTAFDIKKIKSTNFEAAKGGVFKNAGVANGSRHGSSYGQSGIAMYDRMTGAEVGEIEGGEPVMVLSRNTYSNNKPVIDKLLKSSLYNNGAPISMANGGLLTIGQARMYADGGMVGGGDLDSSPADSGGIADNGSTANTDAIIAENKKMQEDMKKIQEDTAKNTKETADTLKSQTGILEKIASKDNGASSILHAISSLQSNLSKSRL